MRVKPNPNKNVGKEKLKVFDPVRREFLPENGRDVPRTAYWLRRLKVGDVILDDGNAPKEAEAPKAKPDNKGQKKTPAPKPAKPRKNKQPAKPVPEAPKAPAPAEAETQTLAKEE